MSNIQSIARSPNIVYSLLKTIPILLLAVFMASGFIKKDDLNWNIAILITLITLFIAVPAGKRRMPADEMVR